jgi:glycogen phosphorylase
VTNGVSPRAWLLESNPGLSSLITEAIGDGWITDLDELARLEPLAEDGAFRERFLAVKRANKDRLALLLRDATRFDLAVDGLIDVHAKRIHAYKRQLLKVLHVVHELLSIVEDGREPSFPRTIVFAGKAAPGYAYAKAVIRLIHDVARAVHDAPRARRFLRVVFVPDYRVSLAQTILPAADLGEQISTAGTEASGTSNMKLAMNGALTIATPDGANIELLQTLGPEGMFVFGLDARQVQELREKRAYRPRVIVERDPRVRRIVEAFRTNRLALRDPERLRWVYETLLDDEDAFMHLADLPSYLDAQDAAASAFGDLTRWAGAAIRSVARTGYFSSDRAVREYARTVWDVHPGKPASPATGLRVASPSREMWRRP